MGRFRSFMRRVAKPAAMVGVSGLLAVSLTVTTTQKAEAAPIAVAPVILAAESIVGGASIPLAMPSLLAASIALHPVGWAIGAGVAVAGLALGAYYTRDYWLPYITGDFGKAKGNANTPAPPGTPGIDPNWTLSSISVSAGTVTVTGNVLKSNVAQDKYIGFSYRFKCNSKADGTGVAYPDQVASPYTSYNMNNSPGTRTLSPKCDYGYVTGAIVGATGADPLLTSGGAMGYPTNVLRWGSMVTNGGAFDPRGADVKYKTTVECIDDNGTKSTITADWAGDNGGAKFPSCAAAGKGHGTGKNKIEGYAPTIPGQAPAPAETLWETTAPAVDPNYAQCDQGRPGNGCKMAITIDGKPCVVGQWECENWSELYNDPTSKPRVGCTYGPYTLSPDACSIMEPAYRPGGAPTTDANVDGNPSTRNNAELNGKPYTPTQAAPVPGGAGAPSPSGDQAMYDCWPTGWGVFNPADWIAKPIRCAFEPKQDLSVRSALLTQKAETKAPISFLDLDMTGPSGGGCPSWNITLPGMGSKNVVCGSSFTDAVVAVRAPLFGLLATAMVWPLLRSIWYAAIPVLRVTPSGGK